MCSRRLTLFPLLSVCLACGLQVASHVAASFVGVGGGAGVATPGLQTRLRLSEINPSLNPVSLYETERRFCVRPICNLVRPRTC